MKLNCLGKYISNMADNQKNKKDATSKALSVQARRFCFTQHTFPYECKLLDLGGHRMTFIAGQVEKAPTTGKEHFQGYFELDAKKSLSAVVKAFKVHGLTPHIEACRGSQADNIKYVSKSDTGVDGTFVRLGSPMDEEEKVDVWKQLAADITSGKYATFRALVAAEPALVGRYTKGVQTLWAELRPGYKFDLLEMYGGILPWQAEVIALLTGPVDPRAVIWLTDTVGNVGKSKLILHMAGQHGFLSLKNGKNVDLSHVWNGEHVTFDFSRAESECINYGEMESIKNGSVFSPKYDSCVKTYPQPHVLVCSNFEPDYEKFSDDRWSQVYKVVDGKLVRITPEMRTVPLPHSPFFEPSAKKQRR